VGQFYIDHKQYAEAKPLLERAVELSTMPATEYILLGINDYKMKNPEDALLDFDRAEQDGAAYWKGRENMPRLLLARIDDGRASAYEQLGDMPRAVAFEEEAIRWMPDNPQMWKKMGYFYTNTGQPQRAEQAYQRASELSR